MKPKKQNPFDNLFEDNSDRAGEVSEISEKSVSRVKGKKSDKSYVASMTYLPKQLKLDIQQELLNLQRGSIDIDFSELVAELLTLYLDIQKSKNPDICISGFKNRVGKYSDL